MIIEDYPMCIYDVCICTGCSCNPSPLDIQLNSIIEKDTDDN